MDFKCALMMRSFDISIMLSRMFWYWSWDLFFYYKYNKSEPKKWPLILKKSSKIPKIFS